MNTLLSQLKNDEAGFVISAELVLVASITVLAMIVGMSEVANNVNQELEDVGSAFGSINQSYCVRLNCGTKGRLSGSTYSDCPDEGDGQNDITCNAPPKPEGK